MKFQQSACIQPRPMSGFRVHQPEGTSQLSITQSALTASQGHVSQTSGSKTKAQNQPKRNKTKVSAEGPATRMAPNAHPCPCGACSQSPVAPRCWWPRVLGTVAAGPLARGGSGAVEEHLELQRGASGGSQGEAGRGQHRTRVAFASRREVWLVGLELICEAEMLGPAQSQNTCLWDIQTA